MPFICVLNKEDRNKLLELGFELVNANAKRAPWFLTAGDTATFSALSGRSDIKYVETDHMVL
jgi:hypothetical protein